MVLRLFRQVVPVDKGVKYERVRITYEYIRFCFLCILCQR